MEKYPSLFLTFEKPIWILNLKKDWGVVCLAQKVNISCFFAGDEKLKINTSNIESELEYFAL